MSSSVLSGSGDIISFDHAGAIGLVAALRGGADALRRDRVELVPLLERATDLLGRDCTQPLTGVAAAAESMAVLGDDLARRIAEWERRAADQRRIDHLTEALRAFRGPSGDPVRSALERERHELLLALFDGDERFAIRVAGALSRAGSLREAVETVLDDMNRARRVEAAMIERGLDLADAQALIDRIDADVAWLVDRGHAEPDAMAAVILADEVGLDVRALAHRALQRDLSLLDAAGQGAFATGLGLTLDEFDAFTGLLEHFAVFDTATFTAADGRVSIADLEFVLAEPCYFTDGQVEAARLLLENPTLLHRLDTANENDDIFGDNPDAAPVGFGRTSPGDGLIAEVDVRAFTMKSQLAMVLGPYADRIDIGDDPKAIVDGYRSENDFRAFLDDNPDLPAPVVAAAEQMIEAGWFDESWWQENKENLALGAALIASGVVMIASGGTASFLVVGAVGATAAGTTTIAINLGTDDDLFEDVGINTLNGFAIGVSVSGVYSGYGLAGRAGPTLVRVHGMSQATASATDLILSGSLDLVTPDEWEEPIHDWLAPVYVASSATETLTSGVVQQIPRVDG